MKFFIDPGHGGTETGAIGHNMIEKNINLTVAMEVKRILELNGQKVKMSRESDIAVSLDERCAMANQWGADYFVSVHHNANNCATSGSELYISIHGGKGADLAAAIGQSYQHFGRHIAIIQKESEKTKGQDYYAVIRQTNMPAIISEYGYMDSNDYINFDTTHELIQEGRMISQGCLNMIGISNVVYESIQTHKHWAQDSYDHLISKGIIINETRFDNNITRGEVFVILSQILK